VSYSPRSKSFEFFTSLSNSIDSDDEVEPRQKPTKSKKLSSLVYTILDLYKVRILSDQYSSIYDDFSLPFDIYV